MYTGADSGNCFTQYHRCRLKESPFPEGSPGCTVDVYIAAKLSPGLEFSSVVQKRKDDPAYLVAFDQAKAYFLEHEMEIPDFNPSCSVLGQTEFSDLLTLRVCLGQGLQGSIVSGCAWLLRTIFPYFELMMMHTGTCIFCHWLCCEK